MSINEDREDLMPQITAEPGTITHTQQLKALSDWDRAQWQAREAAESEAYKHKLASEGDHYASHQFVTNPASENNPFHSFHDTRGREPTGTGMAHGHGFQAPSGLIKIGGYETKPEIAEGIRLSMTPQEWKANTGLDYVSLLNSPAPQQVQATELQKMQAEHQARVDEERGDREAEELDAADAELQEEEQFREGQHSPIETAIENHFGEDVALRARLEVVEKGHLTDETAIKLQVSPETFDLVVQHHVARAEAVLEPLNSSTNMMELGLSEAEQRTARKLFVAGDLQGFKQLGERARNRLADLGTTDLTEMLSPSQVEALQLRDRGLLGPTITIKGLGELSWSQAVRSGYVKF